MGWNADFRKRVLRIKSVKFPHAAQQARCAPRGEERLV